MAKKRNNSLMAAITLPAILLSSVPATADAAKVASEGQHAAKVVRSVLQYSLYKRGKSEVFRRGITYTPMSGSNKMLAYLSKDGVQTTLYLCELDLDIEDNKSTLATRCYRDKGADGSVDAVVDSKKKMSLDGGYEQQFLMAHGADPFRRCLNEKHIEKCVSFKSAQGPKYDRAYSELMQAFLKRTQEKD